MVKALQFPAVPGNILDMQAHWKLLFLSSSWRCQNHYLVRIGGSGFGEQCSPPSLHSLATHCSARKPMRKDMFLSDRLVFSWSSPYT